MAHTMLGYRQKFELMKSLVTSGAQRLDAAVQRKGHMRNVGGISIRLAGIIAAGLVTLAISDSGGPGDPVPGFIAPGDRSPGIGWPSSTADGTPNKRSVVALPDGRFLFWTEQDPGATGLYWFDKHGQFQHPARLQTPISTRSAVVVDAAGWVYVAGAFKLFVEATPDPANPRGTNPGYRHVRLLRLLPSGRLDPRYALTVTNITTKIRSLALQPDGRLVVGGQFDHLGPVSRVALARMLPDGTVDPSFSPVLSGTEGQPPEVRHVFVQTDGKVLAIGRFSVSGDEPTTGIARFFPDGRLDAEYRLPTDIAGESVTAACLLPDDDLVMAVQPRFGPHRVYRFRSDGRPMNGVEEGWEVANQVNTLAAGPEGSFWAGGDVVIFAGRRVLQPVRIGRNGEVLSALPGVWKSGPDGGRITGLIHGLASLADGSVVISGDFTLAGDSGRPGFCRLGPEGAVDLDFAGGGPASPASYLHPAPAGGWYVGFKNTSYYNRKPGTGMVRLLENGLQDPGFDAAGAVPWNIWSFLLMRPDGYLLTVASSDTQSGWSLVRLRPDGGLDPSFKPSQLKMAHYLSAALLSDGRIYLTQPQTNVSALRRLVRLQPNGEYDPSFPPQELPFPYPPRSIATVQIPTPDGGVIVGGDRFLVRYTSDGTLAKRFPIRDRIVHGLWQMHDGHLLVHAGASAGVRPPHELLRLSPAGELDPKFLPPVMNDISAVAPLPDGKILVGSYSWTFREGNQTRPRLARLFPDGSLDLSFDARLKDERVHALGISADGRSVLVGLQVISSDSPSTVRYPLRLLRADSPLLCRVRPAPDGRLHFEVNAAPGTRILVERSTDLRDWEALEEVVLPPGGVLPRQYAPVPGTGTFYVRARPIP